MLNARCSKFFDANAKNIRKRKERNRRTERYSILHVQTAMKYLVTYSQCKIAKANCTNSASYDVKKEREKNRNCPSGSWFTHWMPIFWPYLFTYGNPVKAKWIDSQATNKYRSLTATCSMVFYVSYVGVWEGLEIFQRFPVQLSVRTLWSRQNPYAFIASVSQNWCRCGQHAFPPRAVKGIAVWQEIDLSKISRPSLHQTPAC